MAHDSILEEADGRCQSAVHSGLTYLFICTEILICAYKVLSQQFIEYLD